MDILPEPLEFEWDKGNIDKNEVKHGVTYKEAEIVFANKPFLLSPDIHHSVKEKRFQALGRSGLRLLYIIFTVRKSKIRIISARTMDKKERGIYETAEKIQKNT